MSGSKSAVLLMAYGAAATLEDVPAYLEDIRGGRPPTPELIADVRRRYREMGGKSPLLEITQAQAAALEAALNRKGKGGQTFKAFVGMRHSPPTITDAVAKIKEAGFDSVVAMPLTPFYSGMSVGAYRKKFEEASAGANFKTLFIDSWNGHPKFIEAWAKKVEDTLREFPERGRIETIFSAHSLPRKILEQNDPYPTRLLETAEAIAKKARVPSWQFAYQSKGQTPEPWLGPDVSEILDQLAKRNRKTVVIAPIGFVSDHMETLYDDDILYRRQAESKGIVFKRVPSLNMDPLFIEAMADVIFERLKSR